MTDSVGPVKGDCPCGCGLFGNIVRNRHVRGCTCNACRGRRNRTKGDSKARKARKALGIGGVMSRHEEHWGGALRLEVKAGAQVGPIATRFNAARAQSEAARPVGDTRPFAMVAMPDGQSDGIVLMSLTEFVRTLGTFGRERDE